MKANFPVEYMTAILTAESGDTEKIAEIIHECNKMKIEVLPPSVNESFGGFTVIENAPKENKNGVIRFGLYTVKNLGTDISDAIIAERKEDGLFKDAGNFLERIKHKNLNKKSLEALIKCGAMDMFGDRGTLLANMEDMLAYNKELSASGDTQQTSLFGDMPEIFSASFSLKPSQPASKQEMLAWEKELLGLYISGHPLDRLREKIEANGMNITKLKAECEKGAAVTFAGIIEEVKPIITKNNERMAFVRVADFTSTIECVIFPKVFSKFGDSIMVDKIIAIKGSVSDRNDEKSVLIDAVKVL
jgi:DNA polymerase-3 subunit alpha